MSGLPGLQAPLPQGEGEVRGHAFATSGVVKFEGAATVGWGAGVAGASVAGRMGLQAVLPLLFGSCGRERCCHWEAGVMCAVSATATRFSGAGGPITVPEGLGLQAQPPLFTLVPPPLCILVHPPLDLQTCRTFWLLVCWAEEPLLNYG